MLVTTPPQPRHPSSPAASAPASLSSHPGPHKRRRKNTVSAGSEGSAPHHPPATASAGVSADVEGRKHDEKREREEGGTGGGSSSFRNVSACNRCRLRKNRCDQRLPACLSCEKAAVKCVGYDPITKREIPRSYVHYLETRVTYLESLLLAHRVPFAPAEAFPDLPAPLPNHHSALSASTPPAATTAPPLAFPSPQSTSQPPIDPALTDDVFPSPPTVPADAPRIKQEPDALEENKLDNLVSDIGLVSFAGASDPRYLGSVSGISFARVVFAAVKSSASPSEPSGSDAKARFRPRGASVRRTKGTGSSATRTKDERPEDEDEVTQMRDNFFGFHTRPTISPAPFPDRVLADRLVGLYFEHANPQIPILHRGEFSRVLDAIYRDSDDGTTNQDAELGGTPREKYLLNIVCAIGAGIFLTGPDDSEDADPEDDAYSHTQEGPRKRTRRGSRSASAEQEGKQRPQKQEPESYHASAMMHLESFLAQSKGGLEELQAVLLLASYALLRPVSPGLWYIVGVALRLAVDLGLHYEDTETPHRGSGRAAGAEKTAREGRREWVRDMRRRLWWCVYSLDRLVSTCVGRPFGIADEVISTQFPSLCDDDYIDPDKGITPPPSSVGAVPSYKLVSHHYFRLRLLQSEILQVLQQQSNSFAFSAESSRVNTAYPQHHPYHLKAPYLHKFPSIHDWHRDVDRRLKEWKESAPMSKEETGVAFAVEFLELNYWQTKIMLYRPCLSVPVLLAGELGNSGLTGRPAEHCVRRGPSEKMEDDQVHLVMAEAGSRVLRLYRQLHRVNQVNYTFLATHHLFMAGISFLYAIWHSPAVRQKYSMDEVEFTIWAATSVLGDLIEKCPPAEACKEAFERMSRATLQMCMAGNKRGLPLPSPPVASGGAPYQTGLSRATGTSSGTVHTPPECDTDVGQEYRHKYPAQVQTQHQQQQQQRQHHQWHAPAQQQYRHHAQPLQQQNPNNRRVSKHNIHFDEGFNELLAPARSPLTSHLLPTPPPPYTSTSQPQPQQSQPYLSSPEMHYGPAPPVSTSYQPQQQLYSHHHIDPALGGSRSGDHDQQGVWGENWEALEQLGLGMPGMSGFPAHGGGGGGGAGVGWDADNWSDGVGSGDMGVESVGGGMHMHSGVAGVDLFDGFFFGSGV